VGYESQSCSVPENVVRRQTALLLVHEQPAAGQHRRTFDVARRVARQEPLRLGDVVRLTEAADRDAPLEVRASRGRRGRLC
jgi:hypothetical protein